MVGMANSNDLALFRMLLSCSTRNLDRFVGDDERRAEGPFVRPDSKARRDGRLDRTRSD